MCVGRVNGLARWVGFARLCVSYIDPSFSSVRRPSCTHELFFSSPISLSFLFFPFSLSSGLNLPFPVRPPRLLGRPSFILVLSSRVGPCCEASGGGRFKAGPTRVEPCSEARRRAGKAARLVGGLGLFFLPPFPGALSLTSLVRSFSFPHRYVRLYIDSGADKWKEGEWERRRTGKR